MIWDGLWRGAQFADSACFVSSTVFSSQALADGRSRHRPAEEWCSWGDTSVATRTTSTGRFEPRARQRRLTVVGNATNGDGRLRSREVAVLYCAFVISARYGKWYYALAALPPVAAALTILFAPDPHGHWSEHLWGAYLNSAQLVLLVVLALLLGRRGSSVLLVAALAIIAIGIVYQVIGNYQVAESIWRTTGDPGFGDGYDQGHDRAGTGDLLVVIGGAAFAFIVGLSRRVPIKVAVLALVMVVIPPPFLWPAAGVLMVMLYGLASATGLDRRRVSTATTDNVGITEVPG